MTTVVLGLGNPGSEYARTRHNVGFMVVDELSARHRIPVKERTRVALVGEGDVREHRVVLAKPRTYMNLSGQAAQSLAAKHGVEPPSFLVVVDDFNLPLGRLRVRRDGGAGGHNGLSSLIECLGTQDFPRIRMGVGPLPAGMDQVDFVLGEFLPEEKEDLAAMIGRAADCVECALAEGLEAAMNRFNPS